MGLRDGLIEVLPGQIATVVTTLEMARPLPRPDVDRGAHRIERAEMMPLDQYRDLFRRVGQEWLWFSRLALSDAALAAIVHHPDVEVFVPRHAGRAEGLLELDFRVQGHCELAFFGLTRPLIGTGAGRWLMDWAIARAWSAPIERFWVHTCTLDHPAALSFYRRSGFVPIGQQIEIADDPRLVGLLPREAAPQVPIISKAANGW
ncbi:GNAT family N-acetyltransferase [Lichenifustis flavocetrariae]|uniref:GNAT family N-acetyltransferase n=1 Tax=Lichenifustis flavocetrariae TaxID=2949735 RepID=A0AA42CP19_9HYPH|nr:GNAT family N-acetyltransferase [Lichenifustis flavocetrariae]MCW6509977.1 GNAT family N-acetyltransferase [Lichenifustis flavocetrariae]